MLASEKCKRCEKKIVSPNEVRKTPSFTVPKTTLSFPLIRMATLSTFTFMSLMTLTCAKVSMWIGEDEVRAFAGVPMEISIIEHDKLADYLRRGPKFSATLPPIPPLADSINVTWTSGKGKRSYSYKFLRIKSEDPSVMEGLKLSIPRSGIIPREPTDFRVSLPCTGKKAGIANFKLVFEVRDPKGKPLDGSPIRLKLGKFCRLQNETCLVQKCDNGGICTPYGDCLCPKGFVGRRCERGVHCKNECHRRGVCIRDDVCKCRPGFRGKYCQRKSKRGGKRKKPSRHNGGEEGKTSSWKKRHHQRENEVTRRPAAEVGDAVATTKASMERRKRDKKKRNQNRKLAREGANVTSPAKL